MLPHGLLDPILRLLPALVLEMDADGRIHACNQPPAEPPLPDLLDTNIFDHVRPEDRNAIRQALSRLRESGERIACALPLSTLSDETTWYEGVAQRIDDGRAPRILLVATDATRRKRAEAALAFRVRLEERVVRASAHLASVPAARLDDAIRVVLGEIAQAIDAARGHLVAEVSGSFPADSAEWGSDPQRVALAELEAMPGLLARVRRGQVVRAADDAFASIAEQRELRRLSLPSILLVPVQNKGATIGFLRFDGRSARGAWLTDVPAVLHLLAEILLAALLRRHAENTFRTASTQLARLTPREAEIATRIASGQANKVIAIELGISPRTVEMHRARLMRKLRLESSADLVRLVTEAGLLEG